MYKYFFKSVIDISAAFIGLLITLPVLLSIVVISTILHKENPFFTQKRPGKNGKIFSIYKLKTMRSAFGKNGEPLSDEERLTKFGTFMRKLSLDEIPQLFNVLIGDMSLIGPRPLLPQYLPLYNDFQKRRHDVRPGITGWAQVNGRNAISWEEKFEFDVWYVDNVSFILDIRIVYLTILKVVRSENINSSTAATMEAFKGTNQN